MFTRVAAPHRLALLVLCLLVGLPGEGRGEEYYYGVEINGVLCGYVRLTTAPLNEGPRTLTLLTHESVVKGTLLGAAVDNRLILTYRLDPATNAFTYHSSRLEQGSTRLTSVIRIEGRAARISEGTGGEETVVDLPADVVLANTLFHPHLVADFVAGKAERKVYLLFDGRDNAVRETTYTRKAAETLRLAGQSFDTLVLDSIDGRTGVAATVWLDTRTGIVVQTRYPGNRRTYLAGPAVVEAVDRAAGKPDLNAAILTKAHVSIPDPTAISFMKVQVTARPSGLWLTPAALNVVGQRFTGTVEENAIDGVFEIEHRRYDGAKAPPFPPDFSGDTSLAESLAADGMIQADDPVLRERARQITAGARDSWEAARRLSRWVAANIKGAIPGGVTARGTYDQRAGECGGHSFLLAALCRSVGIPARAVWGCMYAPDAGGVFGQHAWNEVYMGEAGWIPLDTTIGEPEHVDSGHIRIGVHQSAATSLNAQRMEILDYRVGAAPDTAQGAGPPAFDAYVGKYTNVERGNQATVLVKDGALALDIPGRLALSFRNPAQDGAWRSTVSDLLFVSFERDGAGRVAEMQLHQVFRLPRTAGPAVPAADVPADLRPYPGTYLLQEARVEFTVVHGPDGLVINDPLARMAITLRPSGRPGAWVDEYGKFTVRFEAGAGGTVAAMLLDQATIFRR